MRFRKGSKVEVLNKKGLPGSWCQAEIISGNGHTYYVRYDNCLLETGLATEKVPRKVIRPCPPSMQGSRSWVFGDIVEVLENSSWKPAEVSSVVDGGDHFFVKLLGSLRVLRVHVSDLRLRQAWKDDEWIMTGKESQKGNDAKTNMASKVGKSSHRKYKPCTVARKFMGGGKFLDNGINCFVEPYGDFLSNMKKRPYFDSRCLGLYGGAGRKMATARKEGKRQRLAAAHSSNIAGKVDDVVSPPQTMIGEKSIHASLNNTTPGFPELGMARENLDDDTIFFSVGSLGSSDSESLSSSVGSFSPSYCPYRLSNHLEASPVQDAGLPFDDDQNPSGSGGKRFSPEKEGLESEFHQLALKAYHSTMVAFYVSGPLSWEREACLTNLRLILHITNDEHLKELRHLATSKSGSA